MPGALLQFFDSTGFSDYDSRWEFSMVCPRCGVKHVFVLSPKQLEPGFGGNASRLLKVPSWSIQRNTDLHCPACGAVSTLYFSGAAGGRQGEIQYCICGIGCDGKTVSWLDVS